MLAPRAPQSLNEHAIEPLGGLLAHATVGGRGIFIWTPPLLFHVADRGRCVEKFDQDSFTCVCPVGFEGPTCATNIDDCMNDACKNGGVCVDEVNSFKCRCPQGYSGSLCQDNVDECAARPCANGGTCFDMNNDYKCMCRPGFKGKSCTIDINECDSSPCRNGGSCEDQIDSFICHCPPCFTGEQCNVRNDDCHWEPTFRPGNYSIATTPAYSDQLQASSSTDAIILAVGIPIVILFLIIVLMLLAGIFFLHRRSKGQTNIPNDMEAQNAYNARQLYNNIQCGPSTPRNQYDQQHHPDGSFLKPTYKVDNTERYATIKAKHVDNSSLDSGSRPTTPAIVKVTTSGLNAKTPVHAAKGVNDVNSTMNRKAISVDKLNLRRAPHSLERGCVSPDSGCSTSLEPPPLHGMKSEISKDSGLGSPVDDAVDDFADRRQRERTLADLNSCPAVDLPGRGPSDLPRRSRSRTPSHRHQRPSVSSSRDSSLGTATTRVCTDLATQV
uniref:EGF-like domain-containing protein n=1 Tax=Plectus sambesii TaxID=2011161 RepID=A0A914VV71_9BILA